MRPHIRTFAEEAAAALPIGDPVVEIGARPATGQEEETNLRSIFAGHEYIGCDVQEGKGVDRVEDVHQMTFADDEVGTVVTCDTLEHVADPIRALQEIHRVLKPGGAVVMTSVMFFPIHAHPWDFWRFTPEAFSLLLEPFETKLVMSYGWEHMPETVFGVGIKGPMPELTPALFPETHKTCSSWGEGRAVDLGPIRMTTRQLLKFTARESVAAVKRKTIGRTAGR